MTDSNGDYITGWPLEIDIMGLLKEALGPLLMSVVKGKDMGLTDAMRKGAYEGLYAIHKDNEGNYLTPVEVPCYECPMSEMTDDIKEYYYNILPLQGLAEIVGEESIYYFGYDSFGDVIWETEKLHHYIHDVVLPQTGAEQVRLCHISLGGTIAVNYLETYPEDYEFFVEHLNTLTPTEYRIYHLYLEGHNQNEIADILDIKLNTIKYHNKNIYSKLGISSRKQLVRYGILKQYQEQTK